MPTESDNSAVERALLLLETLLEQPAGAEVPELLARVDISRSSLFVLLNTLKTLGYIEQAEKRGRYRAGPRLLAWRGGIALTPNLQTAFHQEASAQNLPETLALALPAPDGALLAAQVEGSAQVRSVYPPAEQFTAASAAAQVLLESPSTETSQVGYALSIGDESAELALPICRDGQIPSAALVLSAPAFRWNAASLERFLPPLREMAARLSYRLGALRYTPWQSPSSESPTRRSALDAAQMKAFLAGPWIARLACLRPDGAPHVVPVWQEWDGKHFYVIAWQGSLWAEYALANPSVSLAVDEPWPPLRRVLARGRALPLQNTDQTGEPPSGWQSHIETRRDKGLLNRLRRRYLGQNSPLPAIEWQAFRIIPDSLTAWQGLA